MPTKRRGRSATKKKPTASARRSPTAATLAKPAFRPRVVKSKRAYSRKGRAASLDQ